MNPEMYSDMTSVDPNAILPVFVDAMIVLLAGAVVLSILQFVLQIMCNYSLYTIASRRGIRHPWMAFVPLTNLWLLGSIADQYQYVAQGEVHSRRKTMLGLGISIAVLMVAIYGLYVALFAVMMREVMLPVWLAGEAAYIDPTMIPVPEDLLIGMGAGMAIAALLVMVLSVILTIYQYICYYNAMASCRPKWSAVFIIFGILCTPLLYLFVFICRNKDGGMPPRKAAVQPAPVAVPQVQAAPVQPVAEAPAAEPVAEPALEAVAEPAVEPTVEPVVEAVAEPVAEETAAVE